MEQRQILHIVDACDRSRAEQVRLGTELGHRCEVYRGADELTAAPPQSGIVLACDDPGGGDVREVLAALAVLGTWLPVLGTSVDPRPSRVVGAIKAGALDYLPLPLDGHRLAQALAQVAEEAAAFREARRSMIEARSRIASLSPREREVLHWLTEGSSNKTIARALSISPRTVEIHRANMMAKLGAQRPADAVRMKLQAHG